MLGLLLLAMGIHLASGLAALVSARSNRVSLAFGTVGALAASAIGVFACLRLLSSGSVIELRLDTQTPIGDLSIGVDALSAFFLLCVYLVSGLGALYGSGYLRAHAEHRMLAPVVFFFAVLSASMAAVAMARDGVLFLMAWEVMSLAGFFLVTFDHDRDEVRRAGMVYLIASHVGVVFLFVLFALFARHAGDFGFASMLAARAPSSQLANLCFALALVGFGTKAGFWLLHTWLPEAHPAAPSHVSATMSGVMIKMGIYGLLRVLTLLGRPPAWWGVSLIAIGALSGVLGVLHALAQHDLKRLLAYHSVENIGIIVLGIGVGVLGQSGGHAEMALLGFGGAILHTLNHGLFKGLLFHGAGSVLSSTNTRDIDSLGGLSRRMPITAVSFLIAAIAISGLPPLNGFVSEWLIYVGAFRGGAVLTGSATIATLAVIPTLALIGGLAAACFVKAFGIVFLGAPRTSAAEQAHDPPWSMRGVMILGAALCIAIGLWPALAFRLVERPARLVAGVSAGVDAPLASLTALSRVGFALLGTIAALTLLRWALLRSREVTAGPTWGCGYEAPTPRMQYTAASFAEPLLEPFAATLRQHVHAEPPTGYFPARAHYTVHPGDVAGERVILPASRRVLTALGRLHVVQHGRVQLYLVYILVTVVVLLLWQLSGGTP